MAAGAGGQDAAKAGVDENKKQAKARNTHNLYRRLGADVTSAVTAGGLVAPLITIVDKCIIENASGKRPMPESIRASVTQLLTRPHLFLTSKSFLLIFAVYGSTYIAANMTDTYKSTMNDRPASSTTSGFTKFVATSATNMSGSLIKDGQFAKMFGTAIARPIPPVTYALFMLRDTTTVFASFNLPSIVAPQLPLSDEFASNYFSRATAAQFMIPAAMQFVSTPLHLYGLDMYNRDGDATVKERLSKIRADYLRSVVARMCRIIPAFGIGGVVNINMRRKLMVQLED